MENNTQLQEIWKPVYGHDGAYEVSNLGHIRSVDRVIMRGGKIPANLRGKMLKFKTSEYGYKRVNLNNKTFLVSRLVARSFIPNPDNKPQVNHINGITGDNRVKNLEWVTPPENIQHSYDNLNRKAPWSGKSGLDNPSSQPVLIKNIEGVPVMASPSIKMAAKRVGASASDLINMMRGNHRHIKGFIYEKISRDEYDYFMALTQ